MLSIINSVPLQSDLISSGYATVHPKKGQKVLIKTTDAKLRVIFVS